MVRRFLCFVFYSLLNSLLGFFCISLPRCPGFIPIGHKANKRIQKYNFCIHIFYKDRPIQLSQNLRQVSKDDASEVRLHSKLELIHKDFLECRDIILLIENQHGFLVIDGFYTTERKRTVAVSYQHCIGG